MYPEEYSDFYIDHYAESIKNKNIQVPSKWVVNFTFLYRLFRGKARTRISFGLMSIGTSILIPNIKDYIIQGFVYLINAVFGTELENPSISIHPIFGFILAISGAIFFYLTSKSNDWDG